MSDLRLAFHEAAPRATSDLVTLSRTVHGSGMEPGLLHLVSLRVSQMNGCSYCVDLHYRDALAKDVPPRKVNAVAAWRDAPFFTERERAALAWAETLTRMDAEAAPDAIYDQVAARFDDAELANLTYGVAAINAWNRVSVGFRRSPDPE
jgi:AhpD family alkylhydroperoxidase